MIETDVAGGPGAAAMSGAGPGAPHMSADLGGLRARENLVPTDGAEAVKMTGTEVPLVSTTGHTMKQAHAATLRPAPLPPPDLWPKVRRASRGPTAQRRTSTPPPAPTNSLWAALHPAPSLAPCPAPALALDPGPDASLEVTDCLSPQSPDHLCPRTFCSAMITRVSVCFCFITFRSAAKGGTQSIRS